MPRVSAGILLWRHSPPGFEVYLAHPGGPFWANKNEGAWTIPKGAAEEGEELIATAVREFEEETGVHLSGPFKDLGEIIQRGGKVVRAWACEGAAPAGVPPSNTVRVKWKGEWLTVPEVDRCEWFTAETAMQMINPAQADLIVRLAAITTKQQPEFEP